MLEPALAGSTEDPAVYKALKHVYQRTENSAKLRELEHHELSLHPANTESASSLSTLDSKSSRVDEAIRTMESQVAQHPDDPSLHEWLAYLYGSSGHKVQYEKELAKAAELNAQSENPRQQFPGPPAPTNDSDRQHLVNVADTLRDLRINPPSDSSNVTSLANVTVERVSPNGQSSQHNQLILLMNTDSGASELFHLSHSVQLRAPDNWT